LVNNVPAGAFVHSYVAAQVGAVWTAGYYFYGSGYINLYKGSYLNFNTHNQTLLAEFAPDPVSTFSTIQAGISGPPAGLVHLARVDISGVGNSGQDDKYSTLAGGDYTVWHGGGVTNAGSGAVAAVTDISW
jgi:hypothetical protein